MASTGALRTESVHIPTAEELEALGEVWHHTFSFITSMCLKCAVELRIPDVIHAHGDAMTFPQVVAALSIAPAKHPALRRLMRILVHNGCFAKVGAAGDEEAYALTPMSRLLVHSQESALAQLVVLELHPVLIEPWYSMSTWFHGSAPTPFEAIHGKGIWDVLQEHQDFARKFHSTVGSDSRLVGKILVKTHSELFDGVRSMVDVAGCMGTLAAAVADAFPNINCTVLDLPHVVAEATVATGTRKNLQFIGGDMFEHVPSADLIVLKWVLMLWTDEECVRILKRCREAIERSKKKGGKVVVIEMVLKDGERFEKATETQLFFHMLMVMVTNTMQREEHEWRKIFLDAGFSDCKFTPFGLRSLIEVYP